MKLLLAVILSCVTVVCTAAHEAVQLPPVIYDPNPGPYIIFMDGTKNFNGPLNPDQLKIVDAAIRGWNGDGMDSFLICSRMRSGEMGSLQLYRNEQLVADALRARGAMSISYARWVFASS